MLTRSEKISASMKGKKNAEKNDSEKKNAKFLMTCRTEDLYLWKQQAKSEGVNLNSWIRRILEQYLHNKINVENASSEE